MIDNPQKSGRIWGFLFEALLVLLILVGMVYRLAWVNWSEGTNLHPDEYGLTNTLTQLSIPNSLADYFNTRLSPISPYAKYDTAGKQMLDGPDNRMRWGQWPIILFRGFGEMTGNTGYNEIRLAGRSLSAMADILSLLFIFLIGRRLYGHKAGLLAAALSALAVMQIQQSHFMTVDNIAVFLTTLSIYFAVRAAQSVMLARPAQANEDGAARTLPYRVNGQVWVWYAAFGVAFGMAVASRINLAPLGGMILLACFISIADLKLRTKKDLQKIALIAILLMALSVVVSLLTFRVTQPMAFRAESGDTTIFTVHLNPDWVASMKVAQDESNGVGGGPPGEQWAHRPAIIFPLMNMVVWGMGLPLGVAAWAGFLVAAWQFFRSGKNWRAHLIPLVWVGGYFLFMGTRWVKSVRYFLPIYPFLCLFAARGLLELWNRRRSILDAAKGLPSYRKPGLALPVLATSVVLLGTLVWATAFVRAIYLNDPTRVRASHWIYQNIPGPIELSLATSDGTANVPIEAPDNLVVTGAQPFADQFTVPADGNVHEITITHGKAFASANQPARLRTVISQDPTGAQPLVDTTAAVASTASDPTIHLDFQQVALKKGIPYFLTLTPQADAAIQISRVVVSNESWDEGIPFPMDGYDPYGQFYTGLTMEVRWPDDEHKRQMFLDTLAKADYVFMPSQRAIWSTDRIPLTYPMTMLYYKALFDGSLGFDLVAQFTSPLKIGPLELSDVGGTAAWNKTPPLPLYNYNFFAAEVAFSVYDHAPVWIFKKRADFNIENAKRILGSVDLNKVVVQGPRDATFPAP